MLVQTFSYSLFVVLCDVNAYKPSKTSQNQGQAFSHSGSWSSVSHSSSSSSSYSSSSSLSPATPPENKICGENSAYTRCPNPCLRTCENPHGAPNCYNKCEGYGCECDPGYVVSENGKCIKLENCPDYLRCNDRNATFKECPNPCPGTCAFPGRVPCDKTCVENGCECNEGFYLNDDGKCVQLQDCPGAKTCSSNETFAFCKAGCPTNNCPVNDNRGIIACSPPFPCGSGCLCKNEYLRSTEGLCILYSDCPPINCTRPNEVYSARPPPCIFESCTDIGKPNECTRTYASRPQCVCRAGFYRNKDGVCVPEEQCSPPLPSCKENEVPSPCKIVCPPQSCASLYTLYSCIQNIPCEQGCDCKKGYLRDANGKCIPSEKCPKNPPVCGYNEVFNTCKVTCPPQTCNSTFTSYLCSNETACEAGCDCRDGYLRNESNICVPSEECFPAIDCEVQQECRPTCADPSPPNCPYIPPSSTNVDSCHCQSGFVLSIAGGKCIKIEECPANQTCNGDPNAIIKECPLPCPSTCDSPNAMPCKRMCDPIGCECKPGYLKSNTGKCILPDECKGGNPCGQNANFVPCRYECSTNYCPKNDNRSVIVCESYPCFSGCSCRLNHKLLSTEDPRCVVSSECPPVECTRQHEIWNPCPSPCKSEYCDAVDSPAVICNTLVLNCDPKCECKKTYFRNDTGISGICVSSKECRRLNMQRNNESS